MEIIANNKKSGNRDKVFTALLVALVALSVFQAFEIQELKAGGIQAVKASESNEPVQKSSGSGGYNLPSNLQGLSDMVGGC